jgi:hypothetical protein
MAVDTRNKRSSAVLVGLPWRGLYPDPDGTVAADDRSHAAGLYGGLEADAPAGTAPTVTINQGAALSLPSSSVQLTASATGSPTPTLSWASDDTDVATVNASSGLVTKVANGTCTITVTADNDVEPNATDTIDVTFRDAVAGGGVLHSRTGNNRRRFGGLL